MRNYRLFLVLGLSLGVSRAVFATCTGAGDPCNAPRNGTITGHSATKISLQVQNSATPNPNLSIFFFQATTLGSPQNVGTPDRNTVIVFTANFNPGTANDIIAQDVQPLLASQTYNTYSKACPPGSTNPTDGGCSAWVSIGSRQTAALTNAGFSNIVPADTQPQQFTARTNSNVVDQENVIAWLATQLVSTEVGSCNLTKSLQPFPDSGAQSMIITSADCGTLLPNRPYTLRENLVYDPTQTAPNYVTTTFYTQAVNPVPLNITGVTHCQATLSFQNSAAAPANPSDTPYRVNIGGPVSSGATFRTVNIGGGVFTSSNSVTFNNLQAGQSYSPNVLAQNRGGGSWRPSATVSYSPGFQTLPWSGNFNVGGITINSATFNVVSLDNTGIVSWQMVLNTALIGSATAGVPPASIPLTGLNSNTSYDAQIRLNESTCGSTLPNPAIQFFTLPAAPTGGSLTAASATSLQATWTDPSTNPNTQTTYRLEYDDNSAFSSPAAVSPNPTKTGGTMNATITSGILPETTYYARVKTISRSGNSANDSAWVSLGSAFTPNVDPTVSPVTVTVHITSATLSVSASDNGGPGPLTFQWTVNPAAGNPTLTSTTGTKTISGNTATNVTQLTFSAVSNYSGTVIVRDNNGAGNSKTVPWSTNQASRIPTTIAIDPAAATVVAGNTQLFTAIVCDQFETGACDSNSSNIIANQSVAWILSGGGTPLTSNGPTYTFSATTSGGPYTLTARLSPATDGTAQITVLASGPQFTQDPQITLNGPLFRTGTISAAAMNNDVSQPTVTHTWGFTTAPSAVTFTPPSETVAHNVVASAVVTFTKAGRYVLTDSLGSGVVRSTEATIPQILDSLKLCPTGVSGCPASVTVRTLESQPFTVSGFDQFGDTMTFDPSEFDWDVTGCNSCISGSGVFSTSQIGQQFTVTATHRATGKKGSALVTAVDFNVSAAYASPVPFKSTQHTAITFRGLGSLAKIRVYTPSGREVFSVESNSGSYLWDVKNSSGEKLASGVYFYIIESPEGKKDGKLIIIQ